MARFRQYPHTCGAFDEWPTPHKKHISDGPKSLTGRGDPLGRCFLFPFILGENTNS